MDPRIGNYYNNPSFGYGGYYLTKDTQQLLADFKGIPQELIRAAVKSNDTRKAFIAEDIISKNPQTVGIYRLIMKTGSDSFRESAVQGVMRRLSDAGIEMIIYEPSLDEGTSFLGGTVTNNLTRFKAESSIILANRMNRDDLDNVIDKVYTRDIFERD